MQASSLQVAGVVAFYMAAALVMIFVNKSVLSVAPGLPLLFIFLQVLIAVVLLHFTALLSKQVTIPRPDLFTAKKLTPVVSVGAVGLIFNTLCLRDVEASFFQIARGMQLPLTILVSSLVSSSVPSRKVLGAATIVTVGFFLGIAPTASQPARSTPPVVSLFYGFLSSLFIAVHAVLIKTALPHCNNSTIQLAWWSNAGGALIYAPALVWNGEHTRFFDLYTSGTLDIHRFASGTVITGFVGFLLSIAGLLSVKVTSPITHMFSSAARSVLQTLIGVWLFNDYLSVNRGVSILVIIGGTILYTYIKSLEAAAAPAKAPGSPMPPTNLYADRSKEDRDGVLPRHTFEANNTPNTPSSSKFDWQSPWSPSTPGFKKDANNGEGEEMQRLEKEKEQV